MQKVLTAEQMRTVDRLTTERYGIPSILLMENAAHAVARVITEKLGGSVKGKSILILCGKGNNGGDGAALARILGMEGAFVEIISFGKIVETAGDARTNFKIFCGGTVELGAGDWSFEFGDLKEIGSLEDWDAYVGTSNQDWNVVVDALFGTGLTRPIEGWMANVLHDINILNDTQIAFFNYGRIRVSVDIPSGLNADSGNVLGENFWSDLTVTFTAPKLANVLPPASSYSKELIIAEIGSPMELVDCQPTQTYLAEANDALAWLGDSMFSDNSYKNKRGHALVIAGSEDYSGAAVLTGNAAMRSGVGLVTLAVPTVIRSEVAARALPDLIVRPFEDGGEIDFAADAILIGCGLDANDSANEAMFRKIVEERTTPVIVDAGALWFFRGLTTDSVRPSATAGGSDLILTPHEGEFLRLLGTDDKEAIKDRVAAVREYAVDNNVILVLKGERVLIGAPDGRVVVNPTGNSGLGKAGNGDTLAGILAGFVAQAVKFEIDIFQTVVAAVYVAGMAGDKAEKKYGKRVMTASDVRDCLVDVFAELNAK